MEMPNLSDGDVISACISKDFFMKAPDESSIMKDFPENATEWIASCGKRCTDVTLPGSSSFGPPPRKQNYAGSGGGNSQS